jgi:molybdenum-dependent DNA-binding transcriptional regulator ModE
MRKRKRKSRKFKGMDTIHKAAKKLGVNYEHVMNLWNSGDAKVRKIIREKGA